MSVYETMGMAWVILATACFTFAVMWLAFRGAKTIYRDSELGAKYRESFNRMFHEGVEK